MRLASYFTEYSGPAFALLSRPYLQELGRPVTAADIAAAPKVIGRYRGEDVGEALSKGDGAALFHIEDLGAKRYREPVVVLIGPGTGSAAEGFAWGMKTWSKARLLGAPTAGAILSGEDFDIAPGWSLTVPTAGHWSTSAENLNDKAVTPHESVPETRADLCAGRDKGAERAMAILTASMRRAVALSAKRDRVNEQASRHGVIAGSVAIVVGSSLRNLPVMPATANPCQPELGLHANSLPANEQTWPLTRNHLSPSCLRLRSTRRERPVLRPAPIDEQRAKPAAAARTAEAATNWRNGMRGRSVSSVRVARQPKRRIRAGLIRRNRSCANTCTRRFETSPIEVTGIDCQDDLLRDQGARLRARRCRRVQDGPRGASGRNHGTISAGLRFRSLRKRTWSVPEKCAGAVRTPPRTSGMTIQSRSPARTCAVARISGSALRAMRSPETLAGRIRWSSCSACTSRRN